MCFFFLAEYGNIILNSLLIVWFFEGGYLMCGCESISLFLINSLSVLFLFILISATLPSFRFDQLMLMGWFYFLPISMCLCMWTVLDVMFFVDSFYINVDNFYFI